MEILDLILSKRNLNEAYLQVYRNKGASGVDGVTVDELKEYLKENKDKIVSNIKQRAYKPQPALRVEIPKDNGKVRLLGIPTVVDRVIQQAIQQVLSPIYEKQFSDSSYGFRPNRNAHMAIIKSLELLNDGFDWIVDIDLERFFDTVHHDRLMNIISRTITDGDAISLIRKYLVSGVMVKGKYEDTSEGTPQGSPLSPLLSNIMLNELDKELEARGLNFIRYADDCNIYVKSEKAANRVMASIKTFIEKKLGLIVNVEKSKVSKPQGIKFLGYGYYKDSNKNYQATVHKISKAKLIRKIKKLTKRKWSVSLNLRLLKLKQLITGWVHYFKLAKMKKFLAKLDENIRGKIRVVIWKQWKTFRKRYESLIKLGTSKRNARYTAGSRKKYMYVCYVGTMQALITKDRLKQRGLTSSLDLYNKVHLVIN